ncbi:hypothetical protein A8B81_15730 [Sulfitobacter pontiacus]|uniref:DUF262 domain-containing protein n=1 Tax=Sulfitobacter pontiacus TaxID=60137 RepID=UPI0007D9C68C|nr:DUF262 domain-containing protein [Sulfitobacter pontiacus]OAN77239.1 hypothetical protein A8B81_15730 [Sulfitobacter pontiacus]
MQPSYIPISQVFSQDQRFTVPLFQRPYVWNKEEQWEPLWDDILGVLGRLRAREDSAVVASHFLGTIVLEQKPTATGNLPRREVIDGQQRLTTLQILLKAVEHAISSQLGSSEGDSKKAIDLAKRQIAKLTANDASEEEIYKVWPTNEDRAPFKAVMDCDTMNTSIAAGRMAEAYVFFHDAAQDFLNKGDPAEMARILSEAVRNYMRLIVLDLDQGDEPQAIFETLNAHGTPLLPADLIKNWLLWEAARQKLDVTQLYETYWRLFDRDHDYWRARVGTGHAARARIDTFLQNWLSKETGEAISPKHLYDRFLKHAENLKSQDEGFSVLELMASIHSDALRYIRIDLPKGNSRFDLFLERLKRLGSVVFYPLLLEVIARSETDPTEADKFGVSLESYLVRRLVCGAQTRSYGSLTLTILKSVRAQDKRPVNEVLDEVLTSLDGSDEWPSDEEFRRNWVSRKFYGYFKRDRVLMILQAIEHSFQSSNGKVEPLMSFDWSQLQIEHIIPQAWESHWPLPEDVLPEDRKSGIQGIGNLTLVSKKLNPSLSNGPWIDHENGKPGKRSGLNDNTMLIINRKLLDRYRDGFCDSAISARADQLFAVAKDLWPR